MNASRLAPSHSFPAYVTAFTHRRRAPAPLMGAGRGGEILPKVSVGSDNAIADSLYQASMRRAAALTPSQSLPHRGGGILHIVGALADKVIES